MIDAALVEALRVSQRLGMLGQRPVDEVIDHASSFVVALVDTTGVVADLGSGGGVPGLVIARARPDLRVLLIERRATRADHLRRLVRRLDLDGRVEVVAADARQLPRRLDPVDAVVARAAVGPARLVALAVPLLHRGGLLVVAEPPPGQSPVGSRWPQELVAKAGLERTAAPDPRVSCWRLVDVSRET